jgi:hypothetical protein
MCTYNGARYVREQLESLAAQTRPPDELVVCDDCSSDGTAAAVREFALTAPFPVRLHVNAENVGSTRNFGAAVALCRGDVIALCDQDDFWLPHKLLCYERAFTSRPGVGLVFTDAEVVDEGLRPLGYRLWQSLDFGGPRQERFKNGAAFDMMLERNIVTGATMAFRAAFKDLVLPLREVKEQGFGLPGWNLIHDGWIAMLVACVADLLPVPEVTMKYRQHPGQQVGSAPPREKEVPPPAPAAPRRAPAGRDSYGLELERLGPLHERLEAKGSAYDLGPAAAKLGARVAHFRARMELPGGRLRRVPRVARELLTLRYFHFSRGVYSAARDLLA